MNHRTGWQIKWVYAGCLAVGIFLIFVGGYLRSAHEDATWQLGQVVLVAGYVVWALHLACGLAYLYSSWSIVPKDLGPIAPAKAVGYFFIPGFNLYWLFVANVSLCTTINAGLMMVNSELRVPRWLAITACIVTLFPCLNLAVAPFVWLALMFSMDRAKEELLSRLAQTASLQA